MSSKAAPTNVLAMKAVGILESVFRYKPWPNVESGIVAVARGRLRLREDIEESALSKIKESEYVWLVFEDIETRSYSGAFRTRHFLAKLDKM